MITTSKSKEIIAKLRHDLGIEGKRGMSRRFNTNAHFEVLPGIFADDVRFRSFIKDLHSNLCKWSPSTIREDGFYEYPAVSNEADKLRTYPGSIRFPLDFGRKRNSIKLKDEHKLILKRLVDIIFSHGTEYTGFIKNNSNFGFPTFATDLEVKWKEILHVYSNIKLFKALHEQRPEGWRKLAYDKLGLMMLSNTQIRLQQDNWINGKPKERTITTFEEQYLGESPNIKSKVMFNDFFATSRTRVVCAMPGLYNAILNTASARYKDGMFKSFPQTYITRGREDLLAKLSNFDKVMGVDVKSFDSNKPEDLILSRIDAYPLTDLGKLLIKDMYYCPWFVSDCDGKGSSFISGDPMCDQFDTWKGTPSGLWETSFGNNIDATFLYLVEMSYYIPNIIDMIPEILTHNADIGACIVGDDQLHLYRGKYNWVYDEIKRNGYRNEYIDLEQEEGVTFLGMCASKDEDDHVHIENNIMSYFIKIACPEKGSGSFYRKYPISGILDRDSTYVHSYLDKAKGLWSQLWRRHFGSSWPSFINQYSSVEALNLSNYEQQFLANPDIIHYKLTEQDIDPEIFKQVYTVFPKDISDGFNNLIYLEKD